MVNSYTGFMPTPERTSLDAIVLAARDLLEQDGLAALTMHAVAHRVGVRAPSLYKRVANRDRLIQLVAEATLTDLAGRLDADQGVGEIANVFRAFGHERPAAFQLVLTPASGTPIADNSFRVDATQPILTSAGRLERVRFSGEPARMVVAWATGFISMELNGSFQMGGDVDKAWAFGVERIVEAITTSAE
jgi:AcrR family transcriptional regulator